MSDTREGATENAADVSTDVKASRSAVWHGLTDPQAIAEYFMGAKVATDWEVGHPITWSGEWKGQAYQDKGEILAFEPEQHVAYSHWSPMGGSEDAPENYHVVDITLVDAGGQTQVRLVQSNLVGGITDDDRANRDDYEQNWSRVLGGLKRVVEST